MINRCSLVLIPFESMHVLSIFSINALSAFSLKPGIIGVVSSLMTTSLTVRKYSVASNSLTSMFRKPPFASSLSFSPAVFLLKG